jgi:hypothetical protein
MLTSHSPVYHSRRRAQVSKSPTGIIPEELMFPARRLEVMGFLMKLPIPGDDKVDLLVGWARMVGVTVNSSQRATVRNTGTDRGVPRG